MAYRQFEVGEEVIAVLGQIGGVKIERRTVARLAGNAVVLDDGSRWTHRGDRWGEGSSFYHRKDALYEKARGEQMAADLAREAKDRATRLHWRDATEALMRLSPTGAEDRKTAADQLTALAAWLANLEIPEAE